MLYKRTTVKYLEVDSFLYVDPCFFLFIHDFEWHYGPMIFCPTIFDYQKVGESDLY